MTSTASGGIGLLAIAWLATRRLSAAELGFFFSFLSFGALVQLADFGLSYASLQTAGRLAGTGRLHDLPAVAKRVERWNLLTAGVATVIVAAVGWFVFSARGSTPQEAPITWREPWIGYLLCVFAVQQTLPGISLREGSGKITQAWQLRLVQEWIGAVACLLSLQAGAGLWSLAAFALARAVVALAWLKVRNPLQVSKDLPAYSLEQWMTEVWPFQWRIGLSGLSGFLIFRAFTPIILFEKGPVSAGQFGLAISAMNLLIAISTSWPMSQAARYSTLFASGRFQELRREFPTMFWASTALAAAAAAALSIVLWWARQRGILFALRLTDPVTTTIILATAVVHHAVICFAMFLRAEGREPLLVPSVLGGAVTVLCIWLTAHFGTARDIAAVNLILALGGIPIVLFLLRSRERRLIGLRE